MRETIHVDFKSSVTLEAEKELFQSTLSAAILAILRELELTVDRAFAQMARSPWRDVEIVSSESAYVLELTRGISTVVGVAREGIEMKKYVRSVCDKIVGCGGGSYQIFFSIMLIIHNYPQSRPRQVYSDTSAVSSNSPDGSGAGALRERFLSEPTQYIAESVYVDTP